MKAEKMKAAKYLVWLLDGLSEEDQADILRGVLNERAVDKLSAAYDNEYAKIEEERKEAEMWRRTAPLSTTATY